MIIDIDKQNQNVNRSGFLCLIKINQIVTIIHILWIYNKHILTYWEELMKKNIIKLFVIILCWLSIHTAYITYDGLNDDIQACDVAVVLGSKVNPNGTLSKSLKGRLERTLELYNKGYFESIIVSGGLGKEGHDEAVVMKEYLVENGVDPEFVYVDSQGINTMATAENTVKISADNDFKSYMVISQFFHISRIKLAFKTVGIEDVYHAHSTLFTFRDIYSVIREFPGYYKYLLDYSTSQFDK